MRRADLIAVTGALVFLALPIAGGMMSRADDPDVSALPSRPDLPDPLVMLNGSRVNSRQDWVEIRRPELKKLFEHYMYGQAPGGPGRVSAAHHRMVPDYFGGKATRHDISIEVAASAMPKIYLLLFVPNKRTRPAPVFLGLNFYGNHTTLSDPTVDLPASWMPPSGPGVKDNKATDAGRGKEIGVWSIEKVIDRGYALATFYCGDIAPDHPGFADGVFPSYDKILPKRPSDAWGAVAAWAWGLSRAVDYLETDPNIDKSRIAVVGHSRLGKAALLAGAFDERIGLTIGHQAGCGGSAPSRGKVGEQVKQINERFPHWFNDEFKKFNDQPEQLPFDQNCLMAMVAPRPLLLTNGTLDTWANPAGQFDALKSADSVYGFLAVDGLRTDAMPEPGKLVGDRLAYHIRPGKHAMLPEDWDTFLAFADKHFKK